MADHNPALTFRITVPLDRDAARRRLADKRRINAAKQLSNELRTAAAGSPKLATLLTAIAAEMDDYLGTRAQAIGTDEDPAVWQAALTLARQLLGEVTE